MVGRDGDDKYLVDNAGDKTFEDGRGGYDVVFTGVSVALTNDQEIEGLSSIDWNATYALTLTGNGLNNYLIGNAGANALDGKAGNERFRAGKAPTAMPSPHCSARPMSTYILGFSAADDTIMLENNGVFTGLATGALPAGAFVIGTAAQDANDRIVYNQATGQLFFDADGSGAGAAVQFATAGRRAGHRGQRLHGESERLAQRQQPQRVLQELLQRLDEARRVPAVDDPVVAGQRRFIILRISSSPSTTTGISLTLLTAMIATSGRLITGVETMPPIGPRLEMVMVEPRQFLAARLAGAGRLRRGGRSRAARPQTSRPCASRITATERPLIGLGRHAHMDRARAVDDVRLVVVARVEHREIGQGPAHAGDQEGEQGELRDSPPRSAFIIARVASSAVTSTSST